MDVDLWGLGGESPKCEVGDGPCICPLNISSFWFEIEVFRQEKGHICHISDFRQQRQAKDRQNTFND